jgi:hypothetical protein
MGKLSVRDTLFPSGLIYKWYIFCHYPPGMTSCVQTPAAHTASPCSRTSSPMSTTWSEFLNSQPFHRSLCINTNTMSLHTIHILSVLECRLNTYNFACHLTAPC